MGLIKDDLRFVLDNETASISTSRVVNIDHKVGHLSSQVKVLRHGHLHLCQFIFVASRLRKHQHLVKPRIVDNGALRAVDNALAITNHALAHRSNGQSGVDGHELRLEKVADLAAQRMMLGLEVE